MSYVLFSSTRSSRRVAGKNTEIARQRCGLHTQSIPVAYVSMTAVPCSADITQTIVTTPADTGQTSQIAQDEKEASVHTASVADYG